MAEDDKKTEEGGVYRVDTVPPPAGEADAYNAPTKVGPINPDAVLELMRAADEEGRQRRVDKNASTQPPPTSKPPSKPSEVPRVYEEIDEDDIATQLGQQAQPPIVENTAPLPPELFAKARQDARIVAPTVDEVHQESLFDAKNVRYAVILVLVIIAAGAASAFLLTRL